MLEINFHPRNGLLKLLGAKGSYLDCGSLSIVSNRLNRRAGFIARRNTTKPLSPNIIILLGFACCR